MQGVELLNYFGMGQGASGANGSEGGVFSQQSSMAELTQLLKALEAGSITGRETTNLTTASGSPLKVESLEKQLKVLTYSMKDIVQWTRIPKKPATNTVEEYNQLAQYGPSGQGASFNEGELPDVRDSIYIRRAQLVKFYGVTNVITHPMMLVNTATVANVKDQENRNGTMFLLRAVNRDIAYGDEEVIPQRFNGIFAQQRRSTDFPTYNDYMTSANVIDLRGGILTEQTLNQGATIIYENFGVPSEIFMPPVAIQDFVSNFYGNKFFPVAGASNPTITGATVGQVAQNFASPFGDIKLTVDRFLDTRRRKTQASGPTSQGAPAAPTAGAAPATPVAVDAESRFAAADAGNYIYAVSALNNRGESGLTVLGAAPIALVAGGAADLQFTATAGVNPTTGFTVYRSRLGAALNANTEFFSLFDISVRELAQGFDAAAAGLVRDKNRFLPDTVQAYMIQADNEVFEAAQLAPLMSMDLATLSPAYRWMILMYLTIFLYAPKKMTRYINIRANNTVAP